VYVLHIAHDSRVGGDAIQRHALHGPSFFDRNAALSMASWNDRVTRHLFVSFRLLETSAVAR
jgi:hypothetical protein